MKLKLLFITIALFVGVGSYGQTTVASSGMGSITCPATPTVTWSTPPIGLTFSQLSRGSGVSCSSASAGISGSGFNVTLPNAITGSKWYKFSITSDASTPFILTAIAIQSQVSTATVSSNVSIQYSIGGSAPTTVIGSFTPTTGSVLYPFNSLNISVGASQILNIYVIPNNLTASGTTCRVENGSSVTVNSGYLTAQAGDWNTGSTWTGGSVPPDGANCTVNHAVTLAASLNNTGTIAVSSTGSLQLNPGGYVSGTSITYAATGSTLIFNNSSLYGVSAGQAFWPTTNPPYNVTISGLGAQTNMAVGAVAGTLTLNAQLDAVNAVTVNGTLQLNTGGFVSTNAPTYGSSSTLVYNTTYGVGTEWTGNSTTAGSGVPKNVTIQNSSTVTMPNSNRGMAGNLNISSGNLTLNATSGDLYLAGTWTRASTASFTPSSRAVFFNGTGSQTVTVSASGTETFNYLRIAGSGTLKLTTGTNVVVNSYSGLTLGSSNTTSNLDLNGQTLTLSGGGDLSLTTAARKITSTIASGKLLITGGTITTTGSGSGALSTDTNTIVDLQNGLDCGTGSLVTINGTLQINANGFCVGNSPKYGSSSLLQYNSASNPYNRQLEWTGNGTTAGTGIPQNVQISNSTTLNYINAGNSGAKGIAGNLTIDLGSSLIMNYGNVSSVGALTVSGNLTNAGTLILGQSSGDDLRLGGNFNNTGGTFNGFDRAIFFIRSATGIQLITAPAGITIPYIVIQPTAGTDTVQLAAGTNLTISAPLAGIALTFTNATDIFDINSNTLTIGTTGIANTITGSGTFKGGINTTTSKLALLGTGSIGTLNFTTSFQNLHTLTLNRENAEIGFTLGTPVTIQNTLILTKGLIDLGTSIMTLEDVVTIGGTPSINSFVITDIAGSTGTLRKRFTTTYPSFTFPIGDRTASTDGAQYSPATVSFSGTTYSATAYINVAVNDIVHPNIDSSTDYITRYWSVNRSGTFTNPNYTFTGIYLPTDIVGTESNSISASWNGTKWTNGSAISSNTLIISGVTDLPVSTPDNHFSAGNRNREINIKGYTGSTNDIVDGSTTTSGLNNTLFAPINIGSSATKDYEIQNLGIAALNLTSTPIVSIGGTNPGDFTVTTIPSLTTITGGSSTTFIITFSPTYAGIRTAIVSIDNNDSDENPYTFLIQGTGTCPTTTNTITPTSGPVGTEVTINATANNLTGATATFNGTNATIVSSTATKLVVLVPTGATSGNLVTTIATGCQATNAFTLIDNKANSCQGGNTASDLFISEVTDSNYGGLTYVEIYNATGVTKNLSGYSINTASNGGAYSGTPLNLSNVNLASGSTYVVALGDDDLCMTTGGNGSLAVQVTSSLGVNFKASENDHIALFNGATKIDSWGIFGDSNWATSTLAIFATETDGATFRRKNTAPLVQPITYSNSDWDIIDYTGTNIGDCANNDYSDIGVYNFISGTPPTVTLHPSYTPTCKATSLTVAGTEGYNGVGDSKDLTYKWLYATSVSTGWTEIASDAGIYSGTATATLSISNISGVLNYQYYCQIRENTNTCYVATKAVKITDGGTATWNGTIPGWTNGPPTLDKLVIINADYNTLTNGDLNACSVVVNDGYLLEVTSEKFVTIQNDLTTNILGDLAVYDNGSLVMINDAGIVTNNGATDIYRKTSPYELYDYVYWSTPVTTTAINNSVGSTFEDWRTDFAYEFLPANFLDADNDGFDDDGNDWGTATTMTPGKGYIIRAPEPIPFVPGSRPEVRFSGTVNNGVISPTIALTPANTPAGIDDNVDDFNLIGNPYPSAIDANDFINTNLSKISGTLYFWTHKADLGGGANLGPDALNYSQDDYAIYNLSGGVATIATTGTASDSGSSIPLGYIASGQGFFVEAVNAGIVIFNNAMRVGLPSTSNSQFYKTASKTDKIPAKDRLWLNLENSLGMFSQQLVGYFDNTTLGYDNGYDGLLSDGGNYINFYSFIDENTYKIQGRPTFDDDDQVRLGYFSAVAGTFNINIDSKEGVFTKKSTPVYLEDKLLNIVHDLKKAPYSFTTDKGTFNDRFVLRYVNKFRKKEIPAIEENDILVSNKNHQIKIDSSIDNIDKVVVYDITGKEIYQKTKINSNELTLLNLVASDQVLLVKIILQNGKTITKKVVY